MSISYNGLWKLLIDKNLKKVDLIERLEISSSTIAKMTKNEALGYYGSMDIFCLGPVI